MSFSENSKTFKILAVILGVLVLSLLAVTVVIILNVSQIWSDPGFDPNAAASDDSLIDPEASGMPDVTYNGEDIAQIYKPEGNVDILLLGVDNRNSGKFTGLSDVMIYLRIDTKNKTLKLASLMRDTLVKIDGHGLNKLNTAYSIGGYKLSEKTIKENFGLAPDYYMVVNFYGMEDIIQALGNVNINLKSDELENLNKSVDELNGYDKNYKSPHVTKSGAQELNGRQAVAYMRIRHPGGDQGRIARQQNVLLQLFKKMKNISLGEIPGLVGALMQYVRTDMPIDKILSIANTLKGMEGSELKTFRYPDDFLNGNYKGKAVVQPKVFNTEIKKLQDFLND